MNTQFLPGETSPERDQRLLREAKVACREKWGRITAYRLGRIFGVHGLDPDLNPYQRHHARKNFLQGVQDATDQQQHP